MMRRAWFELLQLLSLMTFMYSLHLVGNILLFVLCIAGGFLVFSLVYDAQKVLLRVSFTCIGFPIVLLDTKDMLQLYS